MNIIERRASVQSNITQIDDRISTLKKQESRLSVIVLIVVIMPLAGMFFFSEKQTLALWLFLLTSLIGIGIGSAQADEVTRLERKKENWRARMDELMQLE